MYNAFISYSHSQDSKLSSSLEKALEKFAKPTFKRRALHIFRDSNDLSASPDLWGKIEEALNKTENFIFLASPASAASHYCGKEVEYWINNKSIDNFLIALTDGEILWDHHANDFDWTKTTAIPKQLSGVFKNEPLYVDFRHLDQNADLTLDNPDFKTNVVLFASSMHGKSVGDMVGEGVKQHKRTMRIRNMAIGILSTLLIAAILLSVYAMQQKNVAETETARAILNSYISNSQAQFAEDPTKALRLAEQAYNYAVTNEFSPQKSTEQLLKVFYSQHGFYQQETVSNKILNRQNTIEHRSVKLMRKGQAGNGFYYDTEDLLVVDDIFKNSSICGIEFHEIDKDGNVLYVYRFEYQLCNVRFSADGQFLLADDLDGIGFTSHVYKRHSNKRIIAVEGDQEFTPPIATARGNRVFIAGGDMNAPELYIGDWNQPINVQVEGFSGFDALVTTADISKNSRFSAFGSKNGNAAIIDNEQYYQDIKWNINRFKNKAILKSAAQNEIKAIKFIDNDNYVATLSVKYREIKDKTYVQDSLVYVWKTEPNAYYAFNSYEPEAVQNQEDGVSLDYTLTSNEEYRSPAESQTFTDEKSGHSSVFPGCSIQNDQLLSPDGKYYATYEGLFNGEGELLISLNVFLSDNNRAFICFSEDSNYLMVTHETGNHKIFALNPERIIERFNNQSLFGNIATLNPKDKERFGIETNTDEAKQTIALNSSSISITVDDLRLRESPGIESKTISTLGLGSRVTLLTDKSSSKTSVTINGKTIEDYWYLVETSNGVQGWIHGCCFVK